MMKTSIKITFFVFIVLIISLPNFDPFSLPHGKGQDGFLQVIIKQFIEKKIDKLISQRLCQIVVRLIRYVP